MLIEQFMKIRTSIHIEVYTTGSSEKGIRDHLKTLTQDWHRLRNSVITDSVFQTGSRATFFRVYYSAAIYTEK